MAEDDEYGPGDIDSFSSSRMSCMPASTQGRTMTTLYLARSQTEACSGALYSKIPGFAIHVSNTSGVRCAWVGTTTLFGKVIRRYDDVNNKTLHSLVLGTLQTGQQDVWLSGNDLELTGELSDLVRKNNFSVVPVSGDIPPSMESPLSLFDGTYDSHMPDAHKFVVSFCKVDTSERSPLVMGDVLTMVVGKDEMDIFYLDPSGNVAGMHGRLPAPVESYVAEMLRDIATQVIYISWGREIRGGVVVEIQTVLFEIPIGISHMLRDAKLPPALRGSGC